METGQDCAGPSGNFDRLWPSWLTPFGYQSCHDWGRASTWIIPKPQLSCRRNQTVNCSYPECKQTYKCWGLFSDLGWSLNTVYTMPPGQTACAASIPSFWSTSSGYYWPALLWCPVPSAGLSDCSRSWLAQPEPKIRPQPFATFLWKETRSLCLWCTLYHKSL